MRSIYVAAILALACVSVAQESLNKVNPGSLWTEDASDILHDRTASKEGDLITVLITESTAATFTAQTTTSKSDAANINKGLGPVLGNIIPNLGVGASSATQGAGATTQAGSFTGTVTAVVKKVFPNGTMLIEGARDIVYNRETQTIKLTGIVRREDIAPNNTILSSLVANAQIRATGKGQISDRQRKGLLMRLLDWLF